MSYFPSIFKSTELFRSYLLHITHLGDAVVYALDSNGNIASLTTGQIDEALSQSLKDVGYQMVHRSPECLSGYVYDYWSEWCADLNLPKGERKRDIAMALYNAARVDDFILHDKSTGKFSVKQSGQKQDAEQR